MYGLLGDRRHKVLPPRGLAKAKDVSWLPKSD